MQYSSIETCQVATNGPILEVTINRAGQANAFTPVEHEFLHQTWQVFAADQARRVAILTAEGERFFSVGNDLAYALEHGELPMPVTGFAGLTSWFDREKPIIAAVNGIAAGGGFEIALACDLVIAADNAAFSLPEAKVGTYAGAGGLVRLPGLIGEQLAMEMILTGNSISAQRAYQLGLVNQVTETDSLMDNARDFARKILASSPLSVAISKRIINQTRHMTDREAAQKISDELGEIVVNSAEIEEGIAAFLEKRKPNWL